MAAAWTDVIHRRALEVHDRCGRASRELADAAPYLAYPMLVADVTAARARIQVVLSMVMRAEKDINLVSSATAAAELLALRGAAVDPTTPLPSIDYIPDGYGDARLALALLQSARIRAVDACYSAGMCCVHLQTACDLLTISQGLHGLDVYIEALRSFTTINVDSALASSMGSAALAVVVNWLVR